MAYDHNTKTVKLIQKEFFYSTCRAVCLDDGFADKSILSLLELTQNVQRTLLNRWSARIRKPHRSKPSLVFCSSRTCTDDLQINKDNGCSNRF
jgi:hypothetical protein